MPYEFIRIVDTEDDDLVQTILWREENESRDEAIGRSFGDSYKLLFGLQLPACIETVLIESEETGHVAASCHEELCEIVGRCREVVAIVLEQLRRGSIVCWEPVASYGNPRSAEEDLGEAHDGFSGGMPVFHDEIRRLIADLLAEELHTLDLQCLAAPMN